HIVTVQTEHKAVLDTCKTLERDGFEVTYLPVHPSGLLDLDALEAALTDETILVSVMWANNETGVIQPLTAIADRVRSRGILLMTDATQALGKIPVTTEPADVLVASGHKVYGPKGIGFLYASRRRPRVRLVRHIDGGGQERGLRGGTLNVPGIVGVGAAIEIVGAELDKDAARLRALRDRFENELQAALPDIQINGHAAPRLPQTSNITFPGVPSDKLVLALRDLAVSTGSACSSGANKPSHVLKAMGLSDEQARASLRFSLGRFTTDDEIDHAIPHVVEAVQALQPQAIVTP
ncbi:MAG TPA: cysteine desulfurase family protein, partial [Rhodothermales bacterium]|nr:cysteine desulfurase family protein [Rhodothermales bacterium]